ncbi:MAG: alpha-galactosidase [Bacteroidaceae bacterium]|nr:alpha-galactosidase [Bacteroidaceae bacterium]
MTKTLFTTMMTLVSLCMNAQDNIDYGPTMGWSSWNTFALEISETIIKGQADAMVQKGLLNVGYNHINIDDGYFGGRDQETGQLLIHKTRFPNGLKGVVDYIHKKGLKAGIYSDGGYNTCGSYHGGDTTGEGVGLYKHDQQDCDFFFKELGFDFIKVDFCGGDPIHNKDKLDLDEKERYTAIAKAIKNTGRTDVRMNICRWAYPGTWADEAGFSWRTTGDINSSWSSVKSILAENLYMSAYCSKGHYNDMDMLEVGVEKWGNKLTAEENKTHFGMWCIMNSPLLIGCNIKNLDTTTLNLLKNKELIALNQDTLYQQAYLACKTNDCYIMVKDIETRYGNKRAVALYNPNDVSKIVVLNFKDIDLADSVALRDCFTRRNLTQKYYESYQIVVPAHGAKIYVAEAESRLERTCYEAETGYSNAYSEITGNVCQYSEASYCSGGYKAGWLGNNEKNDLMWRNVYSKAGGKYKMMLDYICGESRNVTISINGKKVKTLSCNSGGWDKVGTKTLDIELEPGENIIRLSNASGWMPDIDCMRLECQLPASIDAVKNTKQRNKIYNLQGIELSNKESLPKGIYIIDGKKSRL